MRPAKDLEGVKQEGGKLTALRRIASHHKHGAIWLCSCSCGNTRSIFAWQFSDLHITQCESCVSPLSKSRALYLVKSDIDPIYGNADLMANWERYRDGFDPEQRHLYETIRDGRTGWVEEFVEGEEIGDEHVLDRAHIEIEAVHWVLSEPDPVWALSYFFEEREDRGKEAATIALSAYCECSLQQAA